jgi:hypothetical protein
MCRYHRRICFQVIDCLRIVCSFGDKSSGVGRGREEEQRSLAGQTLRHRDQDGREREGDDCLKWWNE